MTTVAKATSLANVREAKGLAYDLMRDTLDQLQERMQEAVNHCPETCPGAQQWIGTMRMAVAAADAAKLSSELMELSEDAMEERSNDSAPELHPHERPTLKLDAAGYDAAHLEADRHRRGPLGALRALYLAVAASLIAGEAEPPALRDAMRQASAILWPGMAQSQAA